MAVSDFVHTVMRQPAEIVTCDPASRRIEGRLRDGGIIQIAVFNTASFFRWPREGEIWNIVWQNNIPTLDSFIQQPDVSTNTSDVEAGHAVVDANHTHFTGGASINGELIVNGNVTLSSVLLKSPDGTTWSVGIANDGTITTEAT